MPRAARVRVKEVEVVDNRDFTMARLAAARAGAQAAIDAIDETIMLFCNPEEDLSGKKRRGLLSDAVDAAGEVSRGLESAQASFEELTKDDLAAEEPDEGDDDEVDEDPEDEEEDEEDEDDD